MQKAVHFAIASLAFAAAGAQAQLYVEGNLMPTTFTTPYFDFKPTVFSGTVGYGLHPNLAVESLLGLAVKKDKSVSNFDIKSAYNLYLRPRYQLNRDLEVFARIGRVRYQFETAYGTSTEYSNSWGWGASYTLRENLYLTGGYTHLYRKDGIKGGSPNVGLGYLF